MNKKIGLIILDGIGLSKQKEGNAFFLANTPTLDMLLAKYPHCALQASGLPVGLPDGIAGNSEIGHLNIGAGRTIKSELVRINEDIANKKFTNNENLQKALSLAKQKNVKFHLIGLTSCGGTHSQLEHILQILEECGRQQVKTVLHCLTDGRDSGVHDFKDNIIKILDLIKKYPNISIGTIGGRYYGMDRDKRWERINKAVDALIQKGPSFTNPQEYVDNSYANNVTDEFIVPAYNSLNKETKLEKNDIIFFANFRQDRARQLSHMIKQSKVYDQKSILWDLNLTLATIVQYDGIESDIVMYPPQKFDNMFGQVIADAGLKQLRIAETEKYAHVTFFFDGGKEQSFKNEQKILIPSPKVATYDLQPKMSANTITARLLDEMKNYDVVICNYANCDMVGHTGKMDATKLAVETVDACVESLFIEAEKIGMTLFITADHGNCDKMIDATGKPVTSHSTNPVFFISTDKSLKLHDGSLGNIAPTLLKYLGINKPKEMDKESLY